jgi:hypothetical protein
MKRGLAHTRSLPILAVLIALLSGAIGTSAQGPAVPPMPFEDAGACPFEGCVYREWTARAPVQVRAGRRLDTPVVFRLRAGERVTAVTGVVVTLRAGRVQFDKPQRLTTSAGPIEIQPGETLYLLTYKGEGFTKAWFKGKVYDDVDASSVINGACDKIPSRCPGRVLESSRTEWWVQVRNRAGQVGWTREAEQFDGKDALGGA